MYRCKVCGNVVKARISMKRIVKYRTVGGRKSILQEIPACQKCFDAAGPDEVERSKEGFETPLGDFLRGAENEG